MRGVELSTFLVYYSFPLNSFENHEKSKKHKENVAHLKSEMAEEDDSNLEDVLPDEPDSLLEIPDESSGPKQK